MSTNAMDRRRVARAFGDVLRTVRRQRWLSQEALCEGADLDLTYPISSVRGLRTPTLIVILDIAQALGIDPTQLASDTIARLGPDRVIGQQSADQLPWFQIVTLITKIHEPALREWYAREAVAQSWSRDALNIQIKNQLHLRKGAAVTNFDQRLAPPHAGLATQILKDPYHFDFLGLGDEAHERDIENALMRTSRASYWSLVSASSSWGASFVSKLQAMSSSSTFSFITRA